MILEISSSLVMFKEFKSSTKPTYSLSTTATANCSTPSTTISGRLNSSSLSMLVEAKDSGVVAPASSSSKASLISRGVTLRRVACSSEAATFCCILAILITTS